MPEKDVLEEQSRKLNVVIALLLRQLIGDKDFTSKKRKGTGDLAVYLDAQGLSYQDIASILESPVNSVRELVSRSKRKRG
jgi:hypothetical protein